MATEWDAVSASVSLAPGESWGLTAHCVGKAALYFFKSVSSVVADSTFPNCHYKCSLLELNQEMMKAVVGTDGLVFGFREVLSGEDMDNSHL